MLRFLARECFVALLLLAWATTACAAPTPPSGLVASSLKATSFTLTWTAATGGTGGIAGYTVFQNGTAIGSTTSGRTYAVSGLLPTTTYAMTVTARDGAGQVSQPSAPLSVVTASDTTPPTKPVNLVATNVATTTCTLTWTGSTDDVGIAGYNVYRNSVLVGSATGVETFNIIGLAPDSANNLTVRATDAAGNLSAASTVLPVRTLANPPSVPTGLAVSSLKDISFTLSWAVSKGGTGGIAGYDIYQSGIWIASTTTSRTLAVAGLAPTTTYDMTVTARDTAGRVSSASAGLSVTTPVDSTPPTKPSGLATTNVTTTSCTLTWTGSTDDVGVTGYNVYRNSVLVGSTTDAMTFSIAGLTPDTSNNLTVRAKDAAGNLSAASTALAVRTLALPPSIPTGLAVTNLRPASFKLTWAASSGGTGGIAGYAVFVNGTPAGSPAPRSLSLTGLTPTTAYSMTVASRDSAGNISDLSAPFVVTTPADSTAPTVPKGLNADAVTYNSFNLTWTASTDNVGVTGYNVYRNNVLIGNTPTTGFNVTGLAPSTISAMRVKARDAAGNISGYSAILSVTTSAKPNVAPVVTLTSPTDGTTFTLPFTTTLIATATDSDGTVAKVQFFDNGANLGETTAPVSGQPGIWLFTLSSQLSAGQHSLTARATDNQNATGDSASVAITVNNPNQFPTVTLSADVTSSTAPGFVTLNAVATDSDGTISKVEFYESENFLGEINVPSTLPSTYTFPLTLFSTGTYTLKALVTDNSLAQATSNQVVVNVNSGAVTLPFIANFEPTEGYRIGALNGQLSWISTGGVTVAPSTPAGSSQELSIAPAQPAEIYSHDFAANGVSPVFVDFLAHPVAGNDPAVAVMFSTPAAQVALVGTASPAQLWIFGGGIGWYATGATVPTDANGRTTDWIRLTTREDYLTKKWDLYLNGLMIAADVPFAEENATALTDFSVNGHATAASAFDSFYAGRENPIFADSNHNGLDDVWETSHGFPLSTDNRQLSPTGNGVTVLQAYLAGSDPNDFYNGVVPMLSIVSGNNQSASPGQFNAQPLVVLVKNATGIPLANAPVIFTVTTGGGLLSIAATGPTPAATLSLLTAADGTAQAFYKQPATPGTSNQITAAAGTSQVTFQSSSVSASDAPLFNIDFETEEGFVGGPIDGQNGWQTRYGTGGILADATAPSGAQVASVDAFSGIAYTFPTPLSGLCNVDFYARPVAGPNGYHATQYVVGEAGVALVLNAAGAEAEIYTFNYNDYAGAYNFVATGFKLPVDSEGQSGWLHFRFKLNFTHPQWDLYLENALIASHCPMQSHHAEAITVINATSASAYFDYITGTAIPPAPDSDGNGLLDAWEMQNFGQIGIDPTDDPDGDGLTNLQEYQNSTDPNDYFNGSAPKIVIIGGDNQTAAPGAFNAQPLKIVVTNAAGIPLANAPVNLGITSGGGLLSATSNGSSAPTTTVSLRTAADGTVLVYYQQPSTGDTRSQISVAGGGSTQANFTTGSTLDPTDTDGHGLPDAWQLKYFGHQGNDPTADPDKDGISNLREFQLGTDPTDPKNNVATCAFIDLGANVSPIGIATDGMVTVRANCTIEDGVPQFDGIIRRWRGGVSSSLQVPSSLFSYAFPRYSPVSGQQMKFWPEGRGAGLMNPLYGEEEPRLNRNGWIAWPTEDSDSTSGANEHFILCWPVDTDVPIALKGPALGGLSYYSSSGSSYYGATSQNYLLGLNNNNEIRTLMLTSWNLILVPNWGYLADTYYYQKLYSNGQYGPPLYDRDVSARTKIIGENIFQRVIGVTVGGYFAGDVSSLVLWSPVAINDSDQILGDENPSDRYYQLSSVRYPLDADIYGAHVVQLSPGAVVGKPFVLSGTEKIYLTGFNNDQIVHVSGFDASGNVFGNILQTSSDIGRNCIWVAKPTDWGLPPETPPYTPIDWDPPVLPAGYQSLFGVLPGSRRTELGLATRNEADGTTTTRGFILVPAQMAVDANRDGQIKLTTEDFSDLTTEKQPYCFWLNDDIDRTGLTASEATVQDDGDPSKYPNDRDWQRDQISCARDLEDFARLWISTQGLNNSIKPKADGTADLYLGLKWTNITRGAPAIKLYRAADADGGTGYLVTPATAQQQVDPASAGYGNAITVSPEGGGTATTLLDGTTGFILPASVFAHLTDAQPKTFLLFEGCKTGAGQLQLIIYDKTGTKIGEGPSLYLDLKNVKEMYERWTVGDGSDSGLTGAGGGGGAPNPTAALSQDRLPSGVGAFQFGAKQTADDNNYILYVHGWNMPPWEKDAFAETAFKRLYWQGYRGRFGAYQWPNTYHHFSIDGATDYDRGEYSAWLSALPLKNLLTFLHGQSGYNVSVLAHSMGNVVTGEALRIAGQAGTSGLVSVYAASQAAVPAHCYDPSLTGTTNLLDYSLPYFITTPNIYNYWLVAPQSAAGVRSNFYNANDYALSFWETNQKLKPDGSDALYYYLGIDSLDIVDDAFGKWILFPIPHPLHLGTATDVQDRYEIMARAAQARSKALGAVPSVSGFVPQSLQSQWPRDDLSTTHDYSGHPWHSAQFRFTNADQKNYWHALLNQFGLLPL